jgi:hypothetical protein
MMRSEKLMQPWLPWPCWSRVAEFLNGPTLIRLPRALRQATSTAAILKDKFNVVFFRRSDRLSFLFPLAAYAVSTETNLPAAKALKTSACACKQVHRLA